MSEAISVRFEVSRKSKMADQHRSLPRIIALKINGWHLACCYVGAGDGETSVITFLDFRFCLFPWNNVFYNCKLSPQNCALSNFKFYVRKEFKNFSNLTWFETALNPRKWGVISEKFNNLFRRTFWGSWLLSSTGFSLRSPELGEFFLGRTDHPSPFLLHFTNTS